MTGLLRSPQNRGRAAMGQEYEVRFWTERFGVSREDVQGDVDEAGNSVDAIEQRLKGQ